MRREGRLLLAAFFLVVIGVAPVEASHIADPLEEAYSQHVLPYYKVGAGFFSFAVFADTSFRDPAKVTPVPSSPGTANIQLYFFDKTCKLVRQIPVPLTVDNVALVPLHELVGIPQEGVIFADTGHFSDGDNERFLAYIVILNGADNTLTRIDSIPFSPSPDVFGVTVGGHWTRYDRFNTIPFTLGDSTGVAFGAIRTTLTFFNAVGGRFDVTGPPDTRSVLGARDTLREFMAFYGYPSVGDWVTTGTSSVADVTPGLIQLDAFGAAPFPFPGLFLGTFQIKPQCVERVRLRDVLPVLGTQQSNLLFVRIVASSSADAGRTSTCPHSDPSLAGRCGFSGFQETVVEAGMVDLIFSGYFHHR